MKQKIAVGVIICISLLIAIPAILFAKGVVIGPKNQSQTKEMSALCRKDYRESTKDANSTYAKAVKAINTAYKSAVKSLKNISDKQLRNQQVKQLKIDRKATRRQLINDAEKIKKINLERYKSCQTATTTVSTNPTTTTE